MLQVSSPKDFRDIQKGYAMSALQQIHPQIIYRLQVQVFYLFLLKAAFLLFFKSRLTISETLTRSFTAGPLCSSSLLPHRTTALDAGFHERMIYIFYLNEESVRFLLDPCAWHGLTVVVDHRCQEVRLVFIIFNKFFKSTQTRKSLNVFRLFMNHK